MSFSSPHHRDLEAHAHLDTLYREARVARVLRESSVVPVETARPDGTTLGPLIAWMRRLFGLTGARLPR